MSSGKILIIDDEKDLLDSCSRILDQHHFTCITSDNPSEALKLFRQEKPDLVMVDLKMPKKDGMEILRELKGIDPSITVIIITAYASIQSAVSVMKLGAFDYITKPFSMEELILVIQKALQARKLQEGNAGIRKDRSDCHGYPNIVGVSKEMMNIYDLIKQISKNNSSILILGESGTGKELVATAIHQQSTRKNAPLIKVNCAAFPEDLVESELFGYEKGAFTGAAQRKPGRFDRAHEGTIFLDEIGDLPPSVQAKLLRVLQDGSFERLGGTEMRNVDVRVITATNRDLEQDMKNGRFREDLYYRLNVIPVHIPALRERRDDIPILIDHFLDIHNCRSGRKAVLHPDVIQALLEYEFPGNVRELENILERCVTLSVKDTIPLNALPSHILGKQKGPARDTLSAVASEAEKAHIIKVLKATKGNRTKAAVILNISRKNLWEKLKNYNIKT